MHRPPRREDRPAPYGHPPGPCAESEAGHARQAQRLQDVEQNKLHAPHRPPPPCIGPVVTDLATRARPSLAAATRLCPGEPAPTPVWCRALTDRVQHSQEFAVTAASALPPGALPRAPHRPLPALACFPVCALFCGVRWRVSLLLSPCFDYPTRKSCVLSPLTLVTHFSCHARKIERFDRGHALADN